MSEIPDIVDTCPECKSHDVTDSHGKTKAKYNRPRYFCHGCGARFDNPKQYDTVTGEFV